MDILALCYKKEESLQRRKVGDVYKLFDPGVTGKANRLTLKIVTKELTHGEHVKKGVVYGICRKAIETKGEDGLCSFVP